VNHASFAMALWFSHKNCRMLHAGGTIRYCAFAMNTVHGSDFMHGDGSLLSRLSRVHATTTCQSKQEENIMRVREIMSHCFRSIPRNVPIRNAAVWMRDLNVGMFPVEENGEIIGAVTARDITVRGTASGIDPDATPVGDVMSNEIYTCVEDDDLLHAARIMEHHRIRRLMVQNSDGEFVGMLTLADLARHLVSVPLCTLVLQDASHPVSETGARH